MSLMNPAKTPATMHLYERGGAGKKCRFLGWHFIIGIIGAEANPFVLQQTPLRWLKSTSMTLRRWASSSRSNSASDQARGLIFFLNPRFLGMGNHLGPFSEAPDGPEQQEQPVQAVGGQGELRGVTQLPSKLET